MPPSLRLVPLRQEQVFFDSVAALKAKLDADRAELKAPGVER